MSDLLPIVFDDLVFEAGGRRIIDGFSAFLSNRGVSALIGPNGAGKSVTLRLLDGLLVPTGGTVRLGQRAPASVRRSLVFQRPALIRASVAANVALALASQGGTATVKRARVQEALERVGLEGRALDPARKLSGGEQQRVALARAWASQPELLLLDEPTANLDPGATDAIESLIGDFARSGTKVILVSHNLGQVARLAEDVLVLDRGRAVEHGSAAQVLQAPRSPEARAYIAGELPWTPFAAAC